MLPDKVMKVMTDLLYENYGSDLERRVSTLKNVRTLSMPALVIHDDMDTDIPWKDARAVADAWPGAEFMLTHGLGHRRILRDPAVITAITEFIRKI
jgi:pimeloyl-ACP methyl ester carboxylesterase